MSADGKLALADRSPVRISSEEDMVRVHRLRATCDAILVGVGTIVADDCKLYVSPKRVPDPPALTKIVLDASGRTPGGARCLETPGTTIVATIESTVPALMDRLGAEAEVIAFGTGPLVDIRSLLVHLHGRGIRRLMVEGGGEAVWSFLSADLVDELSIYMGPIVIGGHTAPTPADGEGARDLDGLIDLEMLSCEDMGDGLWIRYRVIGRR
jgi:2,5-diamino-6-(ribosylamino)-4(3H)-pyrimidinone 5'-phosphate reductase